MTWLTSAGRALLPAFFYTGADKTANMLTAEKVRELFLYEPDTGAFKWRISRTNSVRVGDKVGYVTPKGYLKTEVDGRSYFIHRLVWLYSHGRWPTGQIDHINGVTGDNRAANLREVPPLWNQQNRRRARADSKTGILGVYQVRDKFRATIQSNRKTVALGSFDTQEDAHRAYVSAKRRMHEGCTI